MAYREYTLEDLIPFGGTRETQARNAAELAALRRLERAALAVVDLGTIDGAYPDERAAVREFYAAVAALAGAAGAEGER